MAVTIDGTTGVSLVQDGVVTAALDVGTSANNVVQLNGSAQLPAVDGSNLTGVATAGFSVAMAIAL